MLAPSKPREVGHETTMCHYKRPLRFSSLVFTPIIKFCGCPIGEEEGRGRALCSGEREDRHRVVEEEGQFWEGLELAIIRVVKERSSSN